MLLPPGYGYRVDSRDRRRMITKLMSHHLEQTRVRIQYRLTMETPDDAGAVRPCGCASGCGLASTSTVPGGGAPGSTDVRAADWRMPISGPIVAVGAHLHCGAKGLAISQPRRAAGRSSTIARAGRRPVNRIRAVLNEPSRIAIGASQARAAAASSAATSPSGVCSSASTSGSRPCSRSAWLVIGPIETICERSGRPAAATKKRTAEAEVNVT